MYAMNAKTIRLALVGKDVSKSVSSRIHTFILQEFGVVCEYALFSTPTEEFDLVMRRLMGDFDGFNVTIPYKRDVIEYLNEVKGDAFLFSSVNTVVTATASGYNTDGIGFMQMLQSNGVSVENKKILVLGLGGSGRSTAAVLKSHGAEVYAYQRNQEKLLETCNELGIKAAINPNLGGYDILINCTGVGMHQTVGRSPVTNLAFYGAAVAVDLIYRPQKSEFLRQAEGCGLKIINGEAMLFYQAYYADCLYLDRTPNAAEADKLYQKYKSES